MADVVTDGGVETNVSLGQTWTAQWFGWGYYPSCNSLYFRQSWRVEWNMNVGSGGITVHSIKMTLWNDYPYDISSRGKFVQGANQTYKAAGDEYHGNAHNGGSWTRTYNIGSRYFSWKGGRYVDFIVNVDLPCGQGYKSHYFQLRKNF